MTAVRILRLSIAAAMLLVAAWFLLPTSMGGSTTYVSTRGTSMEPGVSTGDLAVLRPASSYGIGDVVAFPSEELGATVMHRIVDRDGDRFVTQGDSNSWRDPDRPSADDLHGALWLTVPRGGAALDALSSPWALSGIGAAVAVVLAAVRRPRTRRRGGRPAARPAPRPATRRSPALSPGGRAVVRHVALAAGAVGVLAVTGASALLLLPETQTTSRGIPVTEEGRFTYTGEAVAGTTYPDGVVRTGDPVYTALAYVVTLSYEQDLRSVGDLRAEGSVGLDVTLTASDGWSTELPSGPAVPLRSTPDGATATATVELNTAVASGLLAAHAYEVGTDGGTATLTVTPDVDVEGSVAGVPFATTAPAPLSFSLEPTVLRLGAEPAALTPTGGSTVTVEEIAPRVLALGTVSVPLETARVLALGLALAAALVAVAASWIGSARKAGPADEFVSRHAGRVLPVTRFAAEGTVVDLADPEALYRVATRLDGLVLHVPGPDGDTFAVRDVGTTYRCFVPRPAVAERAPRRVVRARLVRRPA